MSAPANGEMAENSPAQAEKLLCGGLNRIGLVNLHQHISKRFAEISLAAQPPTARRCTVLLVSSDQWHPCNTASQDVSPVWLACRLMAASSAALLSHEN